MGQCVHKGVSFHGGSHSQSVVSNNIGVAGGGMSAGIDIEKEFAFSNTGGECHDPMFGGWSVCITEAHGVGTGSRTSHGGKSETPQGRGPGSKDDEIERREEQAPGGGIGHISAAADSANSGILQLSTQSLPLSEERLSLSNAKIHNGVERRIARGDDLAASGSTGHARSDNELSRLRLDDSGQGNPRSPSADFAIGPARAVEPLSSASLDGSQAIDKCAYQAAELVILEQRPYYSMTATRPHTPSGSDLAPQTGILQLGSSRQFKSGRASSRLPSSPPYARVDIGPSSPSSTLRNDGGQQKGVARTQPNGKGKKRLQGRRTFPANSDERWKGFNAADFYRAYSDDEMRHFATVGHPGLPIVPMTTHVTPITSLDASGAPGDWHASPSLSHTPLAMEPFSYPADISGQTSPTASSEPVTFPLQYWQDLAKETTANSTSSSMFPAPTATQPSLLSNAPVIPYAPPQPESPQLPPDWFTIFGDAPQSESYLGHLDTHQNGNDNNKVENLQNSNFADPQNRQPNSEPDSLEVQWQQSLAHFEQFLQSSDIAWVQAAHPMPGLI
ncbi:hypothetical protein CALCODRAFT_99621 [Calocera cornea HHB12733]|uniref:Uncharacterized protein n=1 Tax=Calocera cornea HHB12733 TaxID=1353952 RepID=A0A165D6N0_9BASI|nr:hypothetical protein CALCODRAFT_99621 [Calocera cornea HHB12733]